MENALIVLYNALNAVKLMQRHHERVNINLIIKSRNETSLIYDFLCP